MKEKAGGLALSYLNVVPDIVECDKKFLGEEPGVDIDRVRSHVCSDLRIGIDRNDGFR